MLRGDKMFLRESGGSRGGEASAAEAVPWLLGWSGPGPGQFMLRVAVVTEGCTLGGSFRCGPCQCRSCPGSFRCLGPVSRQIIVPCIGAFPDLEFLKIS